MSRRPRYTIGVDFGTESGRALLADCADGTELAASVYPYRSGVIDERLPEPDADVLLEPEWALQDPRDYVRTLQRTVPAVIGEAGVDPADVIGIAIDFTSCTMLPTTADATPLCELPDLRRRPHAWVKLWKHHAAQPEADRINEIASTRGERWLPRYGGKISSEWLFAKALQILDEDPEVYERADRLIEATDWMVWQLTGIETRNTCAAGYKAIWSKEDGFPSRDYFAALDPRFARVVDEKMSRVLLPPGSSAGGLSTHYAALTGLPAGTTVAVGNVDAHVSVPAAGITGPGRLLMIMGTSTCHILLDDSAVPVHVPGMCGVAEDGALPGFNAYEAGQSGVGDIFGWFVKQCVPPAVHARATAAGGDVHAALEKEAAALRPGESGLLALDWWNGNRSVLVDADLSGLIVGMRLSTQPAEIYRALIEATAFGTRSIIDAFKRAGVPITEVVACGGLPDRNALLMQIYADVLGCPITLAASRQTPALGSAILAAVAAGRERGGWEDVEHAVRHMVQPSTVTFEPDASAHGVYDLLYAEYTELHDLFGRHGQDVMRRLGAIAREAARGVVPAVT